MERNGFQDVISASDVPTDEELLQDIRRGERSAIVAITQRHELRLARIAYRITGCRHEAEDVRHTVLVRFLQSVDRRQEIERVGAWLTRCTVNEAVARVRRRSVEVLANAESVAIARTTSVPSPLERMQLNESREQLAIALNRMTTDERALLTLRFDDDLTFREIAEVLVRPASTVKSQIAHAIDRLRKLLGVSD